MKNEKEIDIKKEAKHPIIICAIVLLLLGISVLVLNFPDVLTFNLNSIIKVVSALCILIGVMGIVKITRWGLYFLALSLLLPAIFFTLRDASQLVSLFIFLDLIIFIDIVMVYRACSVKDAEVQKKMLKISRKYIFYVAMLFLIILLITSLTILSVAFQGTKASGIMQIFNLNSVVSKIQESGILNAAK